MPGDGEFYALSSVYNVDIIVDKTGRGQWQKFMAVVCTYASSFDSLIILQNQGQKGKVCYGPYVTQPDSCFCCQNIPEIQGSKKSKITFTCRSVSIIYRSFSLQFNTCIIANTCHIQCTIQNYVKHIRSVI